MGAGPHRHPWQRSSRCRRERSHRMEANRTTRHQGRQANSLVQAQVDSQNLVAQTVPPDVANQLENRDTRKSVVPPRAKANKEGHTTPRRPQ
ncbi:hypothetical protein CMUS01_16439 [Colletotrichum musicola]|uniref:Uncharacterized protein n=1 Tax=Colletotrichum musicola TaxID=2175873 RepID=A0A8H6IN71_9PEZI|nr:hypothetical protein CMUS01_16439 [Colletotrichum musicola]